MIARLPGLNFASAVFRPKYGVLLQASCCRADSGRKAGQETGRFMAESVMRFGAGQELYQKQRDFALNLAAFLNQYKHYGTFLALLEAGSAMNGATSDLLAAIEDYPPQQWSILLPEPENLEEVAPYLISLEAPVWRSGGAPLTGFADWLFANRDFVRLGVFFVSHAPFLQIKAFWQRFSHARFSDAKTAYFRFYNPRFFHSLIKNLGKKEYQTISSLLEMIIYFDYFNPRQLHIYRFYPQGYKKEQYDLEKENSEALVRSLFPELPA